MRADCGSYFITMYIETKKTWEKGKYNNREKKEKKRKRKKKKTTKLNRLYTIVFEK